MTAAGSTGATRYRGRIVTPGGVLADGVIVIRDGRIASVGPACIDAPSGASPLVHAAWVLPGLVDIHVHGGGGHSFAAGSTRAARAAARFHLRRGTTTMLASLASSGRRELRTAVRALHPLIDEGLIAGIHLEGPYLSPARCGAHHPARLRLPDLAELASLVDLGGIRMVTLAPELPGALDAIRLLADRGVVVAIGHTDATYEQAVAAIAAGASAATHLGNAMRPMHHREPGPVVALLETPGVTIELIADGHHLHAAMLRHAVRCAGPGRVALVSDALPAAGMPDGRYRLGARTVLVRDQVARLVDGTLAGSTRTLIDSVRRIIQDGHDPVAASRMASATPAAVIGPDLGRAGIAAGCRADLVLLDQELAVTGVVRAGQPMLDRDV
jgi:N-acetylglucosamine-6-phosphate deacetylase